MITNRVEKSPSGTRNSVFDYDSLDRLTRETYSDGSGTVFDEVGYEYDLAGNRTSKTHNGVTVSFELGAGNRMTNWTAQVSTNAEAVMNVAGYSSEDIGTDPRYGGWTVNEEDAQVSGSNFWSTAVFSDLSQTSHTVIAAIGDEAGNAGRDTNTWTLTIITNAAYSFDAAGNVTEIAYNSNLLVRTLGWDSQYQLLAVSNGNTEAESYSYDPFGRRLTTLEGTNTITHLYDGIHCVADVDSSGGLVRSYTYGPGVDNPLAMTVYGAQTNTYYYLTDHLGSVLALTDEDGQLVERYGYDAFGRVKVFDERFEEIAESAYGNRITFQGREYSWATGLYYFRARWYEPVTSRWLSKDPIGVSGGLNQYVAFENSPVAHADPYGENSFSALGRVWRTEQVVDPDHYHGGPGGTDLGKHYHSDRGDKLFPETGYIKERGSKAPRRLSNKERKRLNRALKKQRGRGGAAGVTAALVFAQLVVSEFSGENCARAAALREDLANYQSATDQAIKDSYAAGIGDHIAALTGNRIGATRVAADLTVGGLGSR